MEAAAVCIPIKSKVPWESLAVRKKRDNMKKASLCDKRNQRNADPQKLKKPETRTD